MMDAKLAASSPGPDLKIQIKQGGKSDKAAIGDGKSAFRDTLDERLQANGSTHGRAAPGSEPEHTDGGRQPADQPEDAAAPDGRPVRKKPLILLGANGKPGAIAGQPQASGMPSDSAIFLQQRAGKTEQPNKTTGTLSLKGEGTEEAEADLASALAEGDDALAAASEKIRKAAADDGLSTDENPSTDPEPAAAAKDALVLLKEPATHPVQGAGTVSGPQQQTANEPGKGEGEAPGDRGPIYRISRADGRAASIEVEARQASEESDRSPAAKAEVNSVAVIEQRRFIAPASSNVASIVGSFAGDPEWSRALQPDQSLANAAAQAGSGKVVNTLKIQLHPIELGLVTATLRLRGDELSVELKVDSGLAYRSLRDEQNRIVEALKSHGFAVDQVNISFGAERADSQSANQQNGQSSGFAQQQQQARDGGHNAPTSRERGRYERERNENGTASGDDVRVEAGSAGSAGSRLPGHVYL